MLLFSGTLKVHTETYKSRYILDLKYMFVNELNRFDNWLILFGEITVVFMR